MIEVNLHPSDDRRKRRRSRGGAGLRDRLPDLEGFSFVESLRSDPWNAGLVAVVVVGALFVGFLWLGQRDRAGDLQERLEVARADSVRLADLRSLSDSLTARREDIRSRVAVVRDLDQNRYVWPHLLDEISAALPRLAWLRTVQRQSGLPNLRVQVLGTASTPLVVTEFVRNLEASPYIGEVEIVGTNRQVNEGRATQSFTLSLRYTMPDGRSAARSTSMAATGG